MKCYNFEQLIAFAMDPAKEENFEIASHIARCPECRSNFELALETVAGNCPDTGKVHQQMQRGCFFAINAVY